MDRKELAQAFADRLNMIKNDIDVTSRDIERATGIPHSCIGVWTRGGILPNTYSLIRLAEYFGVTTDWLLGLSDEMGRRSE